MRALLCAAVIALVGCGADGPESVPSQSGVTKVETGEIRVVEVDRPNTSDPVECAVMFDGGSGNLALDCNWP